MGAKPKTGRIANRKLKATVFTLLFGGAEEIKQLVGAIKGKTYGPDTKVKITTLQNAFYMGRCNDLSCELDGKLIVLIEHQSTLSENIPLRMLIYVSELYNRYVKDKDMYRRKKLPLPLPEFIVLYNGKEKMPKEVMKLKLSDMFIEGEASQPASLELTVTMYDINKGRNLKMVKRCANLHGYSIFIDMAREYEKTMSSEEAIWKAMNDCINKNILKIFLEKHKKEVVKMLLREWDMNVALEVAKEEGREEGVEEGWEKGMERGMEEGWKKGLKEGARKNARAMKEEGIDVNTISKITGISVAEIRRL